MCTCVLRAANVQLSSCNSKGMHICYRCTCCTYVSAESPTPSYTCKMDQDYHADHTWVQIINSNIMWIDNTYGGSMHTVIYGHCNIKLHATIIMYDACLQC